MIGPPLDKSKTYNVIGAGVSGLFLGFFLKKRGFKFKIYERSEYVGGLVQTSQTPFGLVESGPNGVMWCPAFEEMCDILDLKPIAPKKEAKERYIYRDGSLKQMPLKTKDLIRVFSKLPFIKRKPFETVADFGKENFGQAFCDYLLAPAVAGIYGEHIDKLSFKGALPMLEDIFGASSTRHWTIGAFSKIKKVRSQNRKSSLKGTHSFEFGMQQLIDALFEYLREDIEFTESITNKIKIENPIYCIPAHAFNEILEDQYLLRLLNEIEYTSLISATAFFLKEDLKAFKSGFGVLVPFVEELNSRGVLFNNNIFENRVSEESLISLTFIINPSYCSHSLRTEAEIVKAIIKDTNHLFGGTISKPLFYRINNWGKALPLYTPNHMRILEKLDKHIQNELPNVHLFGNYAGHISMRKMAEVAQRVTI